MVINFKSYRMKQADELCTKWKKNMPATQETQEISTKLGLNERPRYPGCDSTNVPSSNIQI